jgi:chaperonin GroES
MQGKVIAVGAGKHDDNGKLIPMNVKKGDLVLLPKYGGTEVKIEDQEYQIVREDDILGIVEK